MACEYICDGCGKREPALEINRDYCKPSEWYIRADADGVQVACSRECIKTISETSGKTSTIIPI